MILTHNFIIETVLLSTHNVCFGGEIRKIFFLCRAVLMKALFTVKVHMNLDLCFAYLKKKTSITRNATNTAQANPLHCGKETLNNDSHTAVKTESNKQIVFSSLSKTRGIDALLSLSFGLKFKMRAQWLRGRVFVSRQRGCWFEPHRRHLLVPLSKTHSSLLNIGSTQDDPVQTWLNNCWLGHNQANKTITHP